MRRLVTGFAAIPVALSMLAAAPGADAPCENPDGLEVIGADGLETTIATPPAPLSNVHTQASFKDVIVDLSDVETEDEAVDVGITLSWGVATNDYDLRATFPAGEAESIGDQIVGGAPPEEQVEAFDLVHCDVITVRVDNFAATNPTDSLSLTFEIDA